MGYNVTLGGENMTSTKPFLNFVIEEELLKRIDDYRYSKRFPSRAAAIKNLIEIGLKQEEKKGVN
jgi:metal-responsive CopG/Arc/MetJ family transcriptional regulator